MLDLPTETVLQVLSFLPIRQIAFLRLTSRAWNLFIIKNETSVYHAAAMLHGFAEPHKGLEASKRQHIFTSNTDVASWKDLCRRHYVVGLRWTGQLPARHTLMSNLGHLHRFKIDEEQQTIIATDAGIGGLRVGSIETDGILWLLTPDLVRRFAHCEFGGGFVIFDRDDGSLEVWRRKRDSQLNSLRSTPDARQIAAGNKALPFLRSLQQADRGAFVPFTVISPPHPTRAYRFIYPTLLVASEEAQEAYIFDVPNGQLVQTVSLGFHSDRPLGIEYVELSATHILVCTDSDGLLVYSRYPDCEPPVMQFRSRDAATVWEHNVNHRRAYPAHGPAGSVLLRECSLQQQDQPGDSENEDVGSAVHVSPCGLHLVYTNIRGLLCIIRDFRRALRESIVLDDFLTVIDVGAPIVQMAFEGERIAFHVLHMGLFVVSFTSRDRIPVDSFGTSEEHWPRLYQAPSNPAEECSCVQMNHTGVWYVSEYVEYTGGERDRVLRHVHHIDFIRSPSDVRESVQFNALVDFGF